MVGSRQLVAVSVKFLNVHMLCVPAPVATSCLQSKLDECVTNKHAARVLLQLLAPDSHRYLPQSTYEMLHPPAKSMMVSAAAAAAAAAGGGGGAAAGIDDDDEVMDDEAAEAQPQDAAAGDDDAAAAGEGAAGGSSSSRLVERQLGESRKDPTQRRRELLSAGGKDSLAAALLALCAEQAGQLLCNQVGADVVVEVARGAAGGLLWELQQQGVEAVHAAVVQQVAADCSRVANQPAPAATKKQKGKKGKAAEVDADAGEQDAAEVEQQQEPLLTQYFASRALRRLLLAGGSEGADGAGAGARAFAQQLWQQALQGQCEQLVGSHAEKVLAGLLHCGDQAVQQQAAAELQPLVGDVEAWAAKFWGPAGGQEQQHHSKTKEKKKAKAQQKAQKGQQQQQQQQNGTPAPSAKKRKQRQQ
jgi:pumilio family protein 6